LIAPDVFSHTTSASFLKTLLDARRGRSKSALSLGALSRRLGYRSPRSAAMVLNGTRLPSDRFIAKVADYAGLRPEARRYLELLARKERFESAGLKVTSSLISELRALSHAEERRLEISLEFFDLIGRWYFLVIKQLVTSPAFDGTLEWLQRKLAGRVKPAAVEDAVARMLRLGILRKEAARILSAVSRGYHTPQDIPSRTIRNFHREVMAQAAQALERQSVLEREFQALTFKMRPERMAELKTSIRDFVRRTERDFHEDGESQVFQFNLQIFKASSD
jgi:uncharacterized protein (TIGR02147 family)